MKENIELLNIKLNNHISVMKKIYRNQNDLYIQSIQIFVPLLWLILSLTSLVPISGLQLNNTKISIIFCILLVPIFLSLVPMLTLKIANIKYLYSSKKLNIKLLQYVFIIAIYLFLITILLKGTPPIFSEDPGRERLNWNVPILTVATDIIIRVNYILIISKIINRIKITISDKIIVLTSLVYTLLVVSRSVFIEFLFYFLLALILKSPRKYLIEINKKLMISREALLSFLKILLAFITIFIVFYIYGELREGDRNISDYFDIDIGLPSQLKNMLGWIWGYCIANQHNLRLIIDQGFENSSKINVIGPILNSLQLLDFNQADEYIYIGKSNLGTALRPYILDYGMYGGLLVFTLLWTIISLIPLYIHNNQIRIALFLITIYFGICIPITSRIEITSYIFSYIWIYLLGMKNQNKKHLII